MICCRTLIFAIVAVLVLLNLRPASGDVLQTKKNDRRYFGLIVLETADSIRFRIRKPNGEVELRSFLKEEISESIKTLDRDYQLDMKTTESALLFEQCEQLASIASDLEAESQLKVLIKELHSRDLSQGLSQAVENLAVQLAVDADRTEWLSEDFQALGLKYRWANGDWQNRFVRRLSSSERVRLSDILLANRQGAAWDRSWDTLKQGIESWCSVWVLDQLEGELAAQSESMPSKDLLRLELLLDGVAEKDLGQPNWPRH